MNNRRKYEGQMDPIHRRARSAAILDTMLQHYSSNDALRIIADMANGMAHVIMDSAFASDEHIAQATETFAELAEVCNKAVDKRRPV